MLKFLSPNRSVSTTPLAQSSRDFLMAVDIDFFPIPGPDARPDAATVLFKLLNHSKK